MMMWFVEGGGEEGFEEWDLVGDGGVCHMVGMREEVEVLVEWKVVEIVEGWMVVEVFEVVGEWWKFLIGGWGGVIVVRGVF